MLYKVQSVHLSLKSFQWLQKLQKGLQKDIWKKTSICIITMRCMLPVRYTGGGRLLFLGTKLCSHSSQSEVVPRSCTCRLKKQQEHPGSCERSWCRLLLLQSNAAWAQAGGAWLGKVSGDRGQAASSFNWSQGQLRTSAVSSFSAKTGHLQAVWVPASSYTAKERWWTISFLAVRKINFSR